MTGLKMAINEIDGAKIGSMQKQPQVNISRTNLVKAEARKHLAFLSEEHGWVPQMVPFDNGFDSYSLDENRWAVSKRTEIEKKTRLLWSLYWFWTEIRMSPVFEVEFDGTNIYLPEGTDWIITIRDEIYREQVEQIANELADQFKVSIYLTSRY